MSGGTVAPGSRPGPGPHPARTWVVTVAHGREDHLRRQQRSLALATGEPHEHVVVVIGGSPGEDVLRPGTHVVHLEGGPPDLPVAAARNRGASYAVDAGAQVLVFLDVDCLADRSLVAAYAAACRAEPDTLWSGPVTYLPPGAADAALADPAAHDHPHPGRPAPGPGEVLRDGDPDLFWSLSFACHRRAWRRLGGFCEEYVGYGAEDTDLAAVATHLELRLACLGSARALHQHHPVSRPPVEHLEAIVRNAGLFHARWGRWPMVGWLEEFERRGLALRSADGSWQVARVSW